MMINKSESITALQDRKPQIKNFENKPNHSPSQSQKMIDPRIRPSEVSVNTQIKELLSQLGIQTTDLNLEIANKLLKHGLSTSEKNFAEAIAILKYLFKSKKEALKNKAIDIRDLGITLAAFLLERRIPLEPKNIDLMFKLIIKELGEDELTNYRALDSSIADKKELSYNYYPINLSLKDKELLLELFVLPDGAIGQEKGKDKTVIFCIESDKLGLIKFEIVFADKLIHIKTCIGKEDYLTYVQENLLYLKELLDKKGLVTGNLQCVLDKQDSFQYVESLLKLPTTQLDTKV